MAARSMAFDPTASEGGRMIDPTARDPHVGEEVVRHGGKQPTRRADFLPQNDDAHDADDRAEQQLTGAGAGGAVCLNERTHGALLFQVLCSATLHGRCDPWLWGLAPFLVRDRLISNSGAG